MADTLTETQGCDLLARLFRARGYSIARNLAFREYGVEFHIDGWDAKARVGFEFLTSEDEDHDDLSLDEYKTLTAAQQRGELALFIIDEVEPLSAAELRATANEFLDEAASAAGARLRRASRSRPARTKGGRSTVTKTAPRTAGRATGRKPTAKTVATKPRRKPARKPAPAKRTVRRARG